MINLSNITLVAISSIKIKETINALFISMEGINFGDIKLITHERVPGLSNNIKLELCPKIESSNQYSQFIFSKLNEYIKTEYCLIIQHDGWIIHPEKWDNSWLQYDYIGAPWADSCFCGSVYLCPVTGEHIRVGNGGFSLRSKKLLEIPSKYNLPLTEERGYYHEDDNICLFHRKKFLELGIKYAPIQVAARFSHETPIPEINGITPFGFHGPIGKK